MDRYVTPRDDDLDDAALQELIGPLRRTPLIDAVRQTLNISDPAAADLITYGGRQVATAYNLDDSALQRLLAPFAVRRRWTISAVCKRKADWIPRNWMDDNLLACPLAEYVRRQSAPPRPSTRATLQARSRRRLAKLPYRKLDPVLPA